MKLLAIVALAAVAGPVPLWAADARIHGIDAESTPSGTEVTVRLSGAVNCAAGSLAAQGGQPDRIYLDLEGAKIGASPPVQALAAGPVRQVRTGQFTPSRARVVFDLTRPTSYTVTTLANPSRVVVRLGGNVSAAASETRAHTRIDEAEAGSRASAVDEDVGTSAGPSPARSGPSAATGPSPTSTVASDTMDAERPRPRRTSARHRYTNRASDDGEPTEQIPSSQSANAPGSSAGAVPATPVNIAPEDAAAADPGAPFSLVTATDLERLRQIAAERQAQPLSEDYVIGPDDLLEVVIPDLTLAETSGWRGAVGLGAAGAFPVSPAPSNANGLRVSASGEVTLPVLGPVRAAGYTPRGFETSLEEILRARGILRRPEVRVFVLEYRSRVVSVTGAVSKPGLFPLTGPEATVSDMLWAAGGPSVNAGRLLAFVPADPSGTDGSTLSEPIYIDIGILAVRDGAADNDPPVRPGDAIYVPPAGSVNIDGWVAKPGAYAVTAGLSVAGVVAAAGGAEFPADLGAVEIVRTFGTEKPARFRIDLAAVRKGEADDLPVKDGDVIRVPATPVRLVPWAVWGVARSLVHIGGNVLLF